MSPRELLLAVVKGRTPDIRIQIVRYLISGGVAFIVDTGSLALLTEVFGQELLLLWTALGFAAGLLITYLFSILWIFDERSFDSHSAELLIFVLIGLSGLGLTELLMWLLVGRAGLHYMLSKIITTVIVTAWNFSAKKCILFRKK